MKLIFCTSCQDVFKLARKERKCRCGASRGWYEEDMLHAICEGNNAIPLGFDNKSLAQALRDRPKDGLGSRFEAFVIPEKCDTIFRIRELPKLTPQELEDLGFDRSSNG